MNLVGTLEKWEIPEYENIIKYVTVATRFKAIGKIARKQDLIKLKCEKK